MKYITWYKNEKYVTTSFDEAVAAAQSVYGNGVVRGDDGNRYL